MTTKDTKSTKKQTANEEEKIAGGQRPAEDLPTSRGPLAPGYSLCFIRVCGSSPAVPCLRARHYVGFRSASHRPVQQQSRPMRARPSGRGNWASEFADAGGSSFVLVLLLASADFRRSGTSWSRAVAGRDIERSRRPARH